MVENKLKNLKYSIPLIFSVFLVIGLFNTYINSQQGLQSNEYRFWGIFSLSSFLLMLFSFVILDLVEKRKKSPQKDRITQRIRNFKVKNINVYKLPGIGFKMESILFIIMLYIYFLAPIEVIEYLFALNSPFSIFFIILIIFGVALMIIGFLFGAIRKKEPTERLQSREIQEFVCRGSGTESDPAIIEPSENLPKYDLFLKDSNLFIIIQNCYHEKILLVSCQNIRMENCNIRSISIQYCSKIFVNKSTIRRTLTLWESNNVKFEDCNINRVKFIRSNSNIITNCTIKDIRYVYGSDNIFEANTIAEKCLTKIVKKYWFKKGNLKII